MANEIHSLKIGSTTYPIYPNNVKLYTITSNGNDIEKNSYPLVFSEKYSSTSNFYTKIISPSSKYVEYRKGNMLRKFEAVDEQALGDFNNYTQDCIFFANNGLWCGNKDYQLKLDNASIEYNPAAAGSMGHSNVRLAMTADGDTPGIRLYGPSSDPDSTVNTLYIKVVDSGTTLGSLIFNGSSTSAFMPNGGLSSLPTGKGGWLGNSSNQWQYVYAGNIYKSGSTVSTSDERYKDFIDDINIDFDELKSIPKKLFTWKEGDFYDDKKIHIGTSAQKVKEIYPELVQAYNTDDCTDINDEKTILGVDYEKMSIIALAAIDKLNEKIKEIETKIETLQNDNEALLNEINTAENILNNQ